MIQASFQWQVTPGQAFEQLVENYTKTVFLTGRRVAEARAAEMENWAKANAPWQDRTGNARAGLNSFVKDSPGVVAEIVIQHGVDYGVWLEIAHGGRFAIIAKTIDTYGPLLMRDMQRIMNLKLATLG
jgi:hypothetical protein